MFGIFKKKKCPKKGALDVATSLYSFISVGIDLIETDLPEKVQIATNLYMVGVLDCLSQRFNLSEEEFFEITLVFFRTIGLNDVYIDLLMKFFTNMQKHPKAKECVIKGGTTCNDWLNGNKSIPIATKLFIEEFVEDQDFPNTPGHLYVALDQ